MALDDELNSELYGRVVEADEDEDVDVDVDEDVVLHHRLLVLDNLVELYQSNCDLDDQLNNGHDDGDVVPIS